MGQIERAQTLLERAPIAFMAAFFAVVCLGLFIQLNRERRQHARALAAVNAERLKMAIEQTTLFTRVLVVLEDAEKRDARTKRKGRRREDDDDAAAG